MSNINTLLYNNSGVNIEMAKRDIYNFFMLKVNFKEKSPLVKDYISKFFTDNIDSLSSDGFSKRIIFGRDKRQSLIDIYGVDVREWNEIVKKHPILSIGENVKDVANQLLVMHYIVTGERIYLKFLAVKLFTSKYYRSFPNGIKEAKIKAVIDGLSNKFYIKKHGTLDKSLDATVNTYVTTYATRFNRASDDDLIYIINALSTRVGIFVKNVQNKYYNAPDDIGFFEDREVLEKENKRTTTNDSIIYESVVSTVKKNELSYSVDIATLKSLEGYEYKDVLKNIYNSTDRNSISIIIDEVMNDFLRINNSPSIQKAHDLFLKFSFTNRNRGEKLTKELNVLINKHNITNPDKFKNVLIKYYSIKLYREILKSVV